MVFENNYKIDYIFFKNIDNRREELLVYRI